MRLNRSKIGIGCVLHAVLALIAVNLSAAPASAVEDLELGSGRLSVTIDESWEKVEPRSSIIEAEVSVPAVEGDTSDGRMTFMAAGGGVEANIDRWKSQFSPDPEGKAPRTTVKEIMADGLVVHVVDITGTFKSQPRGPRGPTENVDDQRMLGAIVELEGGAQYFIKLVGPKATIEKNAEAFNTMLEGLKAG